jgi:hypothetical protein
MAISVEQYLEINPMQGWTQNTWDERDSAVNCRFHREDIIFTPWADHVSMPVGVGRNQAFYTGRELVPSHVNHNPIGWYARLAMSSRLVA